LGSAGEPHSSSGKSSSVLLAELIVVVTLETARKLQH
jgi:hypothetical protein